MRTSPVYGRDGAEAEGRGKECFRDPGMAEAESRSDGILSDSPGFQLFKEGGRLTPVAAALGSVLKLKPIMCLTRDGKRLDKFAVKRTMTAAVKCILDYLKEKELGAEHILYISHANALEDAKKIRDLFAGACQGLEIHILELSPVFVAQGGPKCVAIQYIER